MEIIFSSIEHTFGKIFQYEAIHTSHENQLIENEMHSCND